MTCPGPQFSVELVVAAAERCFCDSCPVVVRPALDDRVQLSNQRFLGRILVLVNDLPDVSVMLFDSLFARSDQCLESQGFSLCAFARLVFAHRVLAYVEPQEAEP